MNQGLRPGSRPIRPAKHPPNFKEILENKVDLTYGTGTELLPIPVPLPVIPENEQKVESKRVPKSSKVKPNIFKMDAVEETANNEKITNFQCEQKFCIILA